MIRYVTLAAAAILAVPAAAQQATSQDNLDCAVWAAYKVGLTQDDQARNALSIAMAWFIGQYEGQTGLAIDAALVARAKEFDVAGIDRLTDPCVKRFGAFGDRLTALGAELSKAAE